MTVTELVYNTSDQPHVHYLPPSMDLISNFISLILKLLLRVCRSFLE